jgi:protein O-GlcNAc transferase
LTDPYLDPEGEGDAFYSERSIRLPHSFWCYDPTSMEVAEGFDVGPLPALANGYVTFGCLNSFVKVNAMALALWAKVLTSVGRSRFLMLAPKGASRQRVLTSLSNLGVDSDRIEFVDRQSRSNYLRTYNRIDVGLDTLPYNGHTTSLDSLWMGVPVVSLVGKTVVGRAGFSQLSNLGLAHLAADTPEEFVRIAGTLAADLAALSDLRNTMRERMRLSPLTHAQEFVRDIEKCYRQFWRKWCEGDR